jgi:hypothetical protein
MRQIPTLTLEQQFGDEPLPTDVQKLVSALEDHFATQGHGEDSGFLARVSVYLLADRGGGACPVGAFDLADIIADGIAKARSILENAHNPKSEAVTHGSK